MQKNMLCVKKETDNHIKSPKPLPIERVVGNQAIMQLMLGGDMLWGDEADAALDAAIAAEDPDWMQIINGLSSRPSYASGQVLKVWKAAGPVDQGSGIECVKCGSCGGDIIWNPKKTRRDVWDMGHKAGDEYRKLLQDLNDRKMSYADFLTIYQDPSKYQPEHPKCNRSHKYEKQ